MKKTYDKEFKVMIGELLLSGQSAKTVAEEYGVDASLMRNRAAWRKQLREAEMEWDILKKAVGIGAAFRFSKGDRIGTG